MVLSRQFWGVNVNRASLPYSNVCPVFEMRIFCMSRYLLYHDRYTKLTLSTGFPTFCMYEFDVGTPELRLDFRCQSLNLRTQKNSRALYVHFVRKSTDEP